MKPGKILLFSLLGLALSQLIAWWQQSANPLLSALLTFVAGAIPAVLDYVKSRGAPSPEPSRRSSPPPPPWHAPPGNPSRGYPPPGYPAPRSRTSHRVGLGAVVGVLLVLAVVGGGTAYAVSTVIGRLTGVEAHPQQRLAQPVSGSAGALKVRIEQVAVGKQSTEVQVTATDNARDSVSIPLFDNCQLVEPGHEAFDADVGFGTTSDINVPPGGVPITKTIVFSGLPSDTATSLTLTCSTLYWAGFGQPSSLQVKGIALKAAG